MKYNHTEPHASNNPKEHYINRFATIHMCGRIGFTNVVLSTNNPMLTYCESERRTNNSVRPNEGARNLPSSR